MKKETYKIKCICENCSHYWIEDVFKGQLASGYFTCPFCGCDRGKSQGKYENKQSPAYFYESKFSETPWEERLKRGQMMAESKTDIYRFK